MSRADQIRGEASAPSMDAEPAVERLRAVVEAIGTPDDGVLYRVFLASLREHGDADDLHSDLRAGTLIAEMASSRGWGSRAATIRRLAREAAKAARGPSDDWLAQVGDALDLDTDEGGAVRPHAANVVKILRGWDELGEDLRFNEFSSRLERAGEPLADHDVTDIRVRITDAVGAAVPKGEATDAIELFCRQERSYHPVREYLDGLTWDGVKRLPAMLPGLFAVDPSCPIAPIVGVRWMIGAVRRVYEPGCKFDEVLVLYGAQGARKSAALRALCGPAWFGDSPLPIARDTKDVLQAFPGKWIYEIQEVEQWTSHANQAAVKAITSSQVDYYRPSYGRYYVDWPRQTVLAGTTNVREHLADPTGSRRWWSVQVTGEIDAEAVADARDQLWAEAVARYRRGERSYMTPEERDLQAHAARDYEEEPPEVVLVARWLEARNSREPFETVDALTNALQVPEDRVRASEGRRVARALERLGYRKRRAAPDDSGRRPWVWVVGD